jgi:hypothetical protein
MHRARREGGAEQENREALAVDWVGEHHGRDYAGADNRGKKCLIFLLVVKILGAEGWGEDYRIPKMLVLFGTLSA